MLDHLSRVSRIGESLLRAVAIALALLMFAFAGYSVLDSYYQEHMAFASWDLVRYKPVSDDGRISREKFSELKALNPDVVGWVTIFDTNIDYPILQGPDDLYYVNRDIYGDSTLAGSIYLQSANQSDFSDTFNLLYGHHFDNGAMFGDVSKYKDADFMIGHRYGELITEDGVYDLRIFACIETNAYDSSIYGVTQIEDTSAHSLDVPHKLVYYPSSTDKEDLMDEDGSFVILGHKNVLALSTCDDAETDGRDVVVADVTPSSNTDGDDALNSDKAPGSRDSDADAAKDPSSSNKTNSISKTGEIRPSDGKWAFLNLVSMIFTILCIVPFVVKIFARKENESRPRITAGSLLNIIAAVGAVLLFVFTENMRNPVTLRDQWTPFMLLIFALALLITSFAERRKT